MFRFSHTIAQRLRKLREASQLTQSEVAKTMGMSDKFGHSYITRLEDCKIKNPSFATILNYLDAIGVSWLTFLQNCQMSGINKNTIHSCYSWSDFYFNKTLDKYKKDINISVYCK